MKAHLNFSGIDYFGKDLFWTLTDEIHDPKRLHLLASQAGLLIVPLHKWRSEPYFEPSNGLGLHVPLLQLSH